MKRFQLVMVSLVLLAALVPALAQGPIRVLANGQAIDFGGVPPVQQGGRVLVPLRGVFEALGATVEFDGPTNTVRALRGATRLELKIGSALATVNGQARTLDVPAQVSFGRTLVPLRFVSEAMGAQVAWDQALQTVSITDPQAVVDNTPDVPVNGQLIINGSAVRLDPGPPGTITVRVKKQLRAFAIADNATFQRQTTGAVSPGATPTYSAGYLQSYQLAALAPGEDVRLTLNDQNEVTQIVSLVSLIAEHVRSVDGGAIVLDDAWGTRVAPGPDLRLLDTAGNAGAITALQPGQAVALFVHPDSRTIYQVSAAARDVAAATAAATPGISTGTIIPPPTTAPATGTPRIELVTHNATRSLRAGQKVKVTLRGTPGMHATFDILPHVQAVPMTEEAARPGVYTDDLVIKAHDDILNGRITAHLSDGAVEDIQQSHETISLDTTPPRIVTTFPANGAVIDINQPNLVIYADDLGGSGVANADLTVQSAEGTTRLKAASVAAGGAPQIVTAVPPHPLSGHVVVRGNVSDRAGNQSPVSFAFDIGAPVGAVAAGATIATVTHSATRALQPADVLTVDLVSQPGGQASFDLVGEDNRIVAQALPMIEISRGRYRGTYTVQGVRDAGTLRVVGHFTDAGGQQATSEAAARITVLGAAPVQVSITAPGENQRAANPLTVTGRGAPNAVIEVSVLAQGTQLYIFEYKQDLGIQQVKADGNGNWATTAITLPHPRGVTDLKYVISAVQIDAANRRSDPATVTVTQ